MSDQSSGGSVWSARPIPPLRDLLPSSKRRGKPWAEELMAYWADRFGNVAERNAMVRFVAASLADSTAEKYCTPCMDIAGSISLDIADITAG